MAEKSKVCRTCEKEKPMDQFRKWAASKDGHANRCIACAAAAKGHPSPKGKAGAVGSDRQYRVVLTVEEKQLPLLIKGLQLLHCKRCEIEVG